MAMSYLARAMDAQINRSDKKGTNKEPRKRNNKYQNIKNKSDNQTEKRRRKTSSTLGPAAWTPSDKAPTWSLTLYVLRDLI